MRVHQLLSGAGPCDAITAEALAFRTQSRRWGWGGRDHAARIAPGVSGSIPGLAELAPAPDDVLLLHQSAGFPGCATCWSFRIPLLLYHNVTSPAWLWEEAPLVAAHCPIGREQLAKAVPRVTSRRPTQRSTPER